MDHLKGGIGNSIPSREIDHLNNSINTRTINIQIQVEMMEDIIEQIKNRKS